MATEEADPGFIVVDCESTGLFRRDALSGKWLPADDPDQPHLAFFCGIRTDSNLEIQEIINIPIKPNGWVMEPEATAVTGLTQDFLETNGLPVDGAVDFYVNSLESGRVVIAYNAWFDLKLMRGALRRAGQSDLLEKTRSICTMWALGRPRKLMVRCAELGIPYSGMHSALGDARACLDIARHLKQNGKLPAPRMASVSSNLTGNEQETT